MFAVLSLSRPYWQGARRASGADSPGPSAVLDRSGEDAGEAHASILESNPEASASGVEAGMTSCQALSRCPDLEVLTRVPDQEEVLQTILLQAAQALTPRMEATRFGQVTCDLSGWAGDSTERVEGVLRGLEGQGLEATAGVAPTPDLAGLAAKTARPLRLLPDDAAAIRTFLDPLPLSVMEIHPATMEILNLWGVRSLGALLKLSQDEVGERLGPEIAGVWTRLRHGQVRVLHCTTPPQLYRERHDFEPAVDCLEPLLFILKRLIGRLVGRLEARYLVIERVGLSFQFDDGREWNRGFQVPEPTADVDLLLGMLHRWLEQFRTESPIVVVRVEASPARPHAAQRSLLESALKDPNRFAETLAQLSGLTGMERVGTPQVFSEREPDAFQMVSFREHRHGEGVGSERAPAYGLPLRRFRPPHPVTVSLDEGRKPVAFHSTALSQRVRRAHGPWRSSGKWWDAARQWEREEWDVLSSDGCLYRLVREEHAGGRWVLEGRYD